MKRYAFFSLFLVASNYSHAASIRDVAIEAIKANGQQVQEVLTDSIAGYVNSKFNTTAPLIAQAVLIKRIKPDGCGRVKVDINQAGFKLHPIEFNYCMDGSIPMPENMQGGK